MILSTVSAERRFRNFETINPAEENIRSDGTDVAGEARNLFASFAIVGYFFRFLATMIKGLQLIPLLFH